jgi:trans-aconitate methyltransferase
MMSAASLSKSFDAVAAAYDRARPGYPQQTFDRIVSYAGIEKSPANILEVGAGTGKATRPLAAQGHNILCIEPGTNLARFAAANLATFPNVAVEVTSFEDWTPVPGHFRLAFSAQAFHWLDPDIRLEKLAAVLTPGGSLAVFGNSHSLAPTQVALAVQMAYRRYAPSLVQRHNAKTWYASPVSPVAEELNASPHFCDVEFVTSQWVRELSPDAYRELLTTFSDHSTLPAEQRQPTLDAIEEAIVQHGGFVRLEYTTALFLARSC